MGLNKVWSKPQTKSNQTVILICGLIYGLNVMIWFFKKNNGLRFGPSFLFSHQTRSNHTMTKNHNFLKKICCYLGILRFSYIL